MNQRYLFLALIIVLCAFLRANIIHVPAGQPTIQAGIDAAADGDTVLVAEETYVENISFKGKAILVASHFILDGDTTHIANTVIDGSQPANPDSGSVVYFVSGEDTAAVLSGFTITGGSGTMIPPLIFGSERIGGGILCWNSGARISHNRIRANAVSGAETASGGGIAARAESAGRSIIIEHNTIQGNLVDGDSLALGGGMFIGGDARIRENSIRENILSSRGQSSGSAFLGANFYGSWGEVDISGNMITHNESNSQGDATGAVHCELPGLAMENNVIRYNRANAAVGCVGIGVTAVVSDGSSHVTGNVISHNTSLAGENLGGGLIAIVAFSLRIQENQITHNSASYGGGLATFYASPVIQGNLIAKNSAGVSGGGLWLNKFPFSDNPGEREIEERFAGMNRIPFTIKRIKAALQQRSGAARQLQNEDGQINNNTIADNSAGESGGAIDAAFGIPQVMNSILWGNAAPQNSEVAGEALINYSDVQGGYPGLGNLDLDPVFSDTSNYYLSASQSPCIDAGNPDSLYNDPEDPANPGQPLWPALGTLRNDMGAYGGNPYFTPPAAFIFGAQFRNFLNRVNSAPVAQRPAIVDSFMNTVPAFPFIEGENVVYYIYRGSGNSVFVPGDANGWDQYAFPMTKVQGTNFWYRQEVFEADARLDYKFVLNGSAWILDPLNPRQVWGGFGPNSELAMPAYADPPEIAYYPNIPHGTLHDTTAYSAALNNSRLVRVYTPPSYETSPADSFPVVLFHDGLEYISLAYANNVLDYLIAEQRIQPLIGVFVPPVNRDDEYAFNQTGQFSAFIIDELMPAIDARYRTRRDPASRAMVGISFGGLISTQICYSHPEDFGLCGPYSPAYWPKDKEVYNTLAAGPPKDLVFYVDWGTYEVDVMLDGRALRDILPAKGYEMAWNEWHEGHSWGSWRAHLDIGLEYFFPGPALGVEPDAPLALEFNLEQNYPNPFNPSTTIRYTLPHPSRVSLKIYNILGQEVITLVDAPQLPGEKSVVWEGRDRHGRPVSSGMYFYRIWVSTPSEHAGDQVQARRMLLVR